MNAQAVILHRPERISLERLALDTPSAADAVVALRWSGISTGTERLLWSGRMPDFPGMGYPLVPGYESVGVVVEAGPEAGVRAGQTVFVPGARCFGPVRGLFGGAASHLVSAGARLVPIDPDLAENGTLIALAATAHHALTGLDLQRPLLVVGHGVLGRLVARIARALGARLRSGRSTRPGGTARRTTPSPRPRTTRGPTTPRCSMSAATPASWTRASRA